MQQEVAEELERERKRNLKELAALQHTTATLTRQRDESQRVVLHLRSLINGQTHHMEHIVRSLNEGNELSNYVGGGYDDVPDTSEDALAVLDGSDHAVKNGLSPEDEERSPSRASTVEGTEAEKVTPEMESSLYRSFIGDGSKRSSRLSMGDVADQHLRDKTDAIADIIRNISEQCAAAVEGLQLAHNADEDDDITNEYKDTKTLDVPDQEHEQLRPSEGSEMGEGASENNSSFLEPSTRNSSIPPTPDLIHNRSSTSMSGVTESTGRDRASGQYSTHSDTDIKVVDDDATPESPVDVEHSVTGVIPAKKGTDLVRSPTARLATTAQ